MFKKNADMKVAKEYIKTLNREFDMIIESYRMGMQSGDDMLRHYMERWEKRMNPEDRR